MAQILGWLGTTLFIYGVWILGDKNIKGFYVNAFANALYVCQAVIMDNPSLFWLSIFLIVINLRGAYYWKEK